MDLFRPEPGENLLPCDGVVNSYGKVFVNEEESQRCFEKLRSEIPWRNDEVIVFGQKHVTGRSVAWFDDFGLGYSYSGTTKKALSWTDDLRTLKLLVEQRCGEGFNSCLLNFYHDGSEGMGWHSDDERSLEKDSAIACLSVGAERKFKFRHKRLPLTAGVMLGPGSLLVMRGLTQSHWQHCVPKMLRVRAPRISLTFRRMKFPAP